MTSGSEPLAGEPREREPARRSRAAWVGSCLAWWVLLLSFWIAVDDSLAVDEVLAGAGAAALPVGPARPARLCWRRLPVLRGYRSSDRLAAAARRFQSGVVNDYVTWIVLGLACLGGVLALVASRLLRNPSVWLRSAAISIMGALGS